MKDIGFKFEASRDLATTSSMESLQVLPLILAVLAILTPPASAGYTFGVGDGLAIVLFLVLGVLGVCALLGWIARRRANS